MPANSVIRPELLSIDAYAPGALPSPTTGPAYKLASNESPIGPSPLAMAAAKRALSQTALYPDGSASRLRARLGDLHGISAERIVCGAGSDELLKLIAYAVLRPGDEAIVSAHGFIMHRQAAVAAGARVLAAAERDLTTDVDAILALVSRRTRVVYVANPNNPTGTLVSPTEIRRLRRTLPDGVLLVLDEAYAEYLPAGFQRVGLELAIEADNVVVTRTFSKAYGLAALRLGWMFAPATIVDGVHRIRGAFNVTTPAQAAGLASLGDVDHLAAVVAHNDCWRPELARQLAELDLDVTPSWGNFLLVDFRRWPATPVAEIAERLLRGGVTVRPTANHFLPTCVRITIGSAEAHARLLELLLSAHSSARLSPMSPNIS